MSDIAFSVVIPAFNAADTIEQAIRSVLEQSIGNLEILVVDDGSADATGRIIRNLQAADTRVRPFFLEQNKGVANARNIATQRARGRYIAFLDADDIWYREKLEKQHERLVGGAKVVTCGYVRVYGDGAEKAVIPPERISFDDMLKTNHIGNLTGVYDSHCLGKFYQKPIGHEDYLMWLQILRTGCGAECVPEVLARYRASGRGLSGNRLRSAIWTWKIHREELAQPYFPSVRRFLSYAKHAAKKR